MQSEADLKKLALQVAIQLPDNRHDALRVLDMLRDLVAGWVHRPPKAMNPPLALLRGGIVVDRIGND